MRPRQEEFYSGGNIWAILKEEPALDKDEGQRKGISRKVYGIYRGTSEKSWMIHLTATTTAAAQCGREKPQVSKNGEGVKVSSQIALY